MDDLLQGDALCKVKDKSVYVCSFVNGKPVQTSKKANSESFFSGLFKAALSGAIEGAIIGSISEPCVPEVKVKTSQTIPGSPQYGTKTRTTIKPCASPYKLK